MLVYIRHRQYWHMRMTQLASTLAFCLSVLFSLLAAACGFRTEPTTPAPPPLTFELRTFEKSAPGCGDHGHRDQACVSFRANWPELKGGGGDAASKINSALFTALGFPGGALELGPYAAGLIERWRVEHKGVIYADSTWFERRSIQLLARRPEVWSFRVDRLGQTGKELPFDQRAYLNLDPRTGSAVTLDSLLEKDAAPRFSSLAERRLRETLSLADASALPLKDGRFAMPQQFALTQSGLVLLWSGDALADPDAPRIELTLSWSLVRDLVRKSAVNPPGPATETGF
jgi:hypothetical protein